MIEEYRVGDKLEKDDFIDAWSFPWAAYDYAEIIDITDETVYVDYVNVKDELRDHLLLTRDEFAEMLGWETEDVPVEMDIEEGMDADQVAEQAQTAPPLEKTEEAELLDSDPPIVLETVDGKLAAIHAYSSPEAARGAFEELAG